MHFKSREIHADHVVLVIHGVGDPQPGETMSLFARSVANAKQPLSEKQEVLWLNEKGESTSNVSTFATHLRELDFGTNHAVLAEVFWGDLSRVRRGLWGALVGMIEILFGLRYVSYVAGLQPGPAAMALQRLGLVCINILHGPVLAITFFLALLTLTLAGTELMWNNSYRGVLWPTVLICGCSSIALVASAIGRRTSGNIGIRGFWFWVEVVSTFVLCLMLVKLFWIQSAFPDVMGDGAIRPGLIWYCRVLVLMLGVMWLIEMLVILAMAGCCLVAMTRQGACRRSLYVAFLLPALAVGFWGFALPVMWLSAAKSLRRFVLLEEFESLFDEAVPLLGIQFLMVVVITMIAVTVLIRYFRWRLTVADGQPSTSAPPRLIVNSGLQLATAACTIVGVTLVASVSLSQLAGYHYTQIRGGELLAEANKYAVGFLIPLGFLMFMVFPHLRPAIDIVLDVVNHFFFRPTQVSDILDGDEFDVRESTFASGRLIFARREAIHLRIKHILAFFRDNLETRPSLTVISHSQGTMIAAEVLNDFELSWLNSTFQDVRLVTMGSPLGHLYQHYFEHLYPRLDDPFWKPLRSRLARWINIYRIDDFVGTKIEFPGPMDDNSCVYANCPVGPRGHLNYWTDLEVLSILRRELLQTDESEQWSRAA